MKKKPWLFVLLLIPFLVISAAKPKSFHSVEQNSDWQAFSPGPNFYYLVDRKTGICLALINSGTTEVDCKKLNAYAKIKEYMETGKLPMR